MSFEILCDSDDRERWLVARRNGIGASDVAGIIGVSPWTSPLSIYADKLGLRADDLEESEAQRWGRILEPHIIDEFARNLGRTASRYGKLVRSTRWPWMLATCDGTQVREERPDLGTLEVKATGFRVGDWDDGIPDHVRVQAQHQLAVTGCEWGSVAVLLGGVRMMYADVERDEVLIEKLVEATHDFWQRVEKREPPNPDGSEASREALRALYPKDSGEVVTLPGDLVEVDRLREGLAEELAALKKSKDLLDQQILAALGSASMGVLANGVTYTNRLQKRDGYIVKPTEFRVLRRSKKK